MNDFFITLHKAFAPRPDAGLQLLAIVGGLVAVLVAVWAVNLQRRRKQLLAQLARYISERNLTADESLSLQRIARRAGVHPLMVATRIHVFESASALALRGHEPEVPALRNDVFAQTERLRTKLGFHKLPPSFPLLTSRELQSGFPLEVLHETGKVVDVTEAFFAADLPGGLGMSNGTELPLKVLHLGEAQYELKCKILKVEALPNDGSRIFFSHCESPQRIQHRENVRVSVRGTVVVTPNAKWLIGEADHITAELVNISAGGLLAISQHELPDGVSVRLAFELGDFRFKDVIAAVLSNPKTPEGYALHLEFNDIGAGQREYLRSWITRQTSHRRS